jgi:vacuolar-type H+-ATPase subunit F/Vma7
VANDVELNVVVETKDAERDLATFKKNATSNISAIDKAFGNLRTAAIAAVAAFAAKNVFDFFKSGVDAAAEAEVAFGKMQKALELSGNAAPGVAESFNQLSDNIERVTGISAEAIQNQIGIAQAFGLTNNETQKLIIAATELSAATGDSLDSSVQKLGNTLNGTIGSLKRTVPELSKLDEEALKAGKAIDFIIDRFGGTAVKNLETFAGATEQVGIAFGKIPEAFGEVIVQNETLRQALKTITNVFFGLADIVTQNQGSMSKLVTLALDPLMGALSAAIRIIGFFNNAINGIQLGILSLGKVALDASAAIQDFGATIAKITFGGRQYEEASKSAQEARVSADEYTKALQLMNDQIIKEKKDFDKLNDSILDYKNVAIDAEAQIKKLVIAESGASKGRQQTAKDISALEKSFESFYDKMQAGAVNSLEGQLDAYEEYLDEFERLRREIPGQDEKFNKLRENIQRSHEQKVTEIVKKETEDRKKEIQAIVTDSNFFALIKVGLDPNSGEDLKKAIRTAIGTIVADVGASAVSAVSNGAAGADAVSQLVTGLVSKIPVVGGLIAELIKLAAQAPEENKKNIQGFAKGIPEFLDNINTNLGSLSTILNEVIGPIITKVIAEVGLADLLTNLFRNIFGLPELIKTIATGVRDGIKESAGELANAIKKAFADTGAEATRFFENARSFFGVFSEQVRAALKFVFADNPLLTELRSLKQFTAALTLIVQFIANLIQTIPGAFIAIRDALNGIAESFFGAFENLGAKFTDGFLQIRDQIVSSFQGVFDAFKELPTQFADALSDLFEGLRTAITDAFTSLTSGFDKLAEKLGNIAGGGGKISAGGGGGFLGTGLGAAKGLTEVPSGFPNDTFPARLTSGERVVDNSTNQDLKDFLANSRSGGLGNDQMIALLSDISSKLGNSSGTTIELTLDKKVLSRTILDLNRRNERLSV